MFGLDPQEAARLRRPRPRIRWWVVLLEVLVAVLVVVPVLVVDHLVHPEGLNAILREATKNGPQRVAIDEVQFLPVGRWDDPLSWRIAVVGLAGQHRDPLKPGFRVLRATTGIPRVRCANGGRGLAVLKCFHRKGLAIHLRRVDLSGLRIMAHQQRPPDPWTPIPSPIARLTLDEGWIRDATYDAPFDDPLPSVSVGPMRAYLPDVAFEPEPREVTSGVGWVKSPAFATGDIHLDTLDFPHFSMTRSSLHFEGTARFGGNTIDAIGDVRDFHILPSVEVDVSITDGQLGSMVKTATGRDSPVEGLVTATFKVLSGGERPRGDALISGDVLMEELAIQLDRSTRYVVLDLLTIAPWVELDHLHRVLFEPMRGRLTFRRGTATFQDLRYPFGPRRQLQFHGTIGPDELYLVVRLMPFREPELRPGIGAVMWSGGVRDRLKVRLATRADLLKPSPWSPWTDEAALATWQKLDALQRSVR